MRTLTTLSLNLATALILSTAALGALAEPPAGGPHGPHGHFADELNLTDEQRAQIREIRARDGSREEINAVLTPEQQARAKELKAARYEKKYEALGLTDEQRAEMDAIRARGGSKEELRAVLTDEQRAKMKQMRSEYKSKHHGPPPAP